MRCLFWNIRGIGNLETQIHLFHLIKSNKPDFLFLAEPIVSFNSLPGWYWKRLNLHNNAVNFNNCNSTLWCLWNKKHNVTTLHNTAQCIAFTFIEEGTPNFIAAIYASTFYVNRRELWLDLSNLLNNHHGPWMFLGDFNSILGAHEKFGGRLPLRIACSDFINWTNVHSLVHLDTNGAKFTWTNKREGGALIKQRLDRTICNDSWLDHWSVVSCNTLIKCHSDHFPLLLTLHKHMPIDITPKFKFFTTWTAFDSCEDIISSHWNTQCQGTPMHILHYKLKSLKPKLQVWNKTVVGNLHLRVHHAQQQLNTAQMAIDQLGYSLERSQDEAACMTSYSQALNLLNSFWQEKNKNVRFLEGDRNTAFFHRQAKIRNA